MYFPVFSHKQVHCFLNLRSTIFYMTYAMHNTSIFSCIMAVISNFTNFYNFKIFIFNFFFFFTFFLFVCFFFFAFSYDFCYSFVNKFIFFFLKSINLITCFLKNSQSFLIQSLPLFTSRLLSMLLNEDIVVIEKPDGICLLTLL